MKNIVQFRKDRQKTKDWNPRKKFKHFSGIRLLKLKNIMRSVRNLSNKRYYDYDDQEKKRFMRDMSSWYQEMYRAWKNAGKMRAKGTVAKKSYWDLDNGNN